MTIPELLLAREVRRAEGGADRLERAAANGQLARVLPGVYADGSAWAALAPAERHRAMARALHVGRAAVDVFSHETAAALHAIPVIGDWPDRPHSTVPPHGSDSSGVMLRTQRVLDAEERVVLDGGLRATSLARTAVDLAASRSLLAGIVAISDVRARGVLRSTIEAAIDALGAGRGVRRARIALGRSSARAESPLETLVIVRCEDLGFERPEQQVLVAVADGAVYRCDFAWRAGEIVGEADGRSKYRDPRMLAGRSAEQIVWEEKRREDAIRLVRRAFVRLDWRDAWDGSGLQRSLDRAGVPRVRSPRPLTR